MPSSLSSLTLISRCSVFPKQKSSIESLKLFVSDLPMLSCQYIQKGVLFTRPPISIEALVIRVMEQQQRWLKWEKGENAGDGAATKMAKVGKGSTVAIFGLGAVGLVEN
ncbi:hypothetical protein NE237_014085 [Protea cynaroides]|uniref:Uncharacterized protein n=1 Tax=Protea cynaroides TaxID=273540 RepID=A0A9Q0JZK8_9MAGN|nr:hypothetical protein NE237_014085 [Protea cynaroides]